MLKLMTLERFLIDHMTTCDRKALKFQSDWRPLMIRTVSAHASDRLPVDAGDPVLRPDPVGNLLDLLPVLLREQFLVDAGIEDRIARVTRVFRAPRAIALRRRLQGCPFVGNQPGEAVLVLLTNTHSRPSVSSRRPRRLAQRIDIEMGKIISGVQRHGHVGALENRVGVCLERDQRQKECKPFHLSPIQIFKNRNHEHQCEGRCGNASLYCSGFMNAYLSAPVAQAGTASDFGTMSDLDEKPRWIFFSIAVPPCLKLGRLDAKKSDLARKAAPRQAVSA
ncbi:hypothetical protein [Methylocapsa palsarum]|uniref:hypothetical protein n=1 Tax=Methylocapsa palsarum TaxID=1612308 RepID=UPI0011140ED2|nr:hypothetical protein [Methylocapsa palsarum]